jgi:hypothetical protein
MFKLFDGTFTTTLSHAPSADRAIAFPNASGTLATLEGANVFTGATVNSTAGAASLPAMRFSGVPFAGTGTTSFPLVYIADANATASTVLSTAGTYFGVNGDGTQDLMHLLKDGASRFKVGSEGNITALGNITLANGIHSILGDGANNLIIRSASNICRINGAGVGDDRLVLGATTDAFPQFRRSGIGIVVGLADNTDGGSFTCSGTLAVNGATTLTGNLTSNGALISVPEALAPALDAGAAVGVTTLTSTIAVNGTNAVTLANGTNGQIKTIVCTAVTSAGTATVTPTTANGFTTIAFTAAGQSVTLQYFTTGGWVILSVRNATIAALGDAQRHRCSGEALALCA